jgi:hypothetical protein
MADHLAAFVELARQKGMEPATIFLLLKASGWKDREIADVLARRELGAALPERSGVGSARDAFFHLLAFTALYAWVISLIYLLFTYIEFALPDAATRTSSYAIEAAQSGIRASLATLIVAYPLFVIVWWMLLREIRHVPEMAKSGVRRWLSSLSLFVGAVTILGNVIAVVYYLVEGDLTLRFLLKVAVLVAVAGAISAYLALTLRSEAEARG